MTPLEGLASGASPRIAAQLFNSFSTVVEKFSHVKILRRLHFLRQRLTHGAMLCQPFLVPTRYGDGTTGVKTSREDATHGTAIPPPRYTSTIAGTNPGKRERFI